MTEILSCVQIEYAPGYFLTEIILCPNWIWLRIFSDRDNLMSKLNMLEDISRQKWSRGVEAGVAQRLPSVPKGSAGISYPALDESNILSSYNGDAD